MSNEIDVSRMPRIPGDNSSSPSLELRFISNWSTRFPDDAADSRRTKVEPEPSEYLRHTLVAHRWEESLQLSDEVPDEIRVTIESPARVRSGVDGDRRLGPEHESRRRWPAKWRGARQP